MNLLKIATLLAKIGAGVGFITDILPPKWAGIAYLIASCVKDIAVHLETFANQTK